MIDKVTFIIIIIKLIGIQIILMGMIVAFLKSFEIYSFLVSLGSLIFAIGSNVLLGYTLHKQHKPKRAGGGRGKAKTVVPSENSGDANSSDLAGAQALPQTANR